MFGIDIGTYNRDYMEYHKSLKNRAPEWTRNINKLFLIDMMDIMCQLEAHFMCGKAIEHGLYTQAIELSKTVELIVAAGGYVFGKDRFCPYYGGLMKNFTIEHSRGSVLAHLLARGSQLCKKMGICMDGSNQNRSNEYLNSLKFHYNCIKPSQYGNIWYVRPDQMKGCSAERLIEKCKMVDLGSRQIPMCYILQKKGKDKGKFCYLEFH